MRSLCRTGSDSGQTFTTECRSLQNSHHTFVEGEKLIKLKRKTRERNAAKRPTSQESSKTWSSLRQAARRQGPTRVKTSLLTLALTKMRKSKATRGLCNDSRKRDRSKTSTSTEVVRARAVGNHTRPAPWPAASWFPWMVGTRGTSS